MEIEIKENKTFFFFHHFILIFISILFCGKEERPERVGVQNRIPRMKGPVNIGWKENNGDIVNVVQNKESRRKSSPPPMATPAKRVAPASLIIKPL